MYSTSSNRRQLLKAAAGMGAWSLITDQAWAQNAEFKLKLANNFPATHPTNLRMKEAVEAIRADSKGRVDIQLFPNNQLGGDTDMLSQVRSGAIDFFMLSGLILQTLVPVAGINGLAFVFKDYNGVWAAMDGDLGLHVRGAIAKVNLFAFETCFDNGFRNITSSSRSIQSPADLQGFKIRVPVSPLWTSMFKALGASPASINFSEVYSSLQTKIVEGQENPLPLIESAKLYEVQKYCSMTSHMWDGQWVLANQKRWGKLPKDLQALVALHFKKAAMLQREDIRQLNTVLQAQLKSKGMAFNYPDAKPFRDVLTQVGFYQEWKAKYGPEAIGKLEKYTGKLA
jgi:TRAP-type transport system periplasmic protein